MKRSLIFAFLILVVASGFFAQDSDLVLTTATTSDDLMLWPTPDPTPEPTPICDHESNSAERFSHMRLLPPLKIKNFDPRRIEYLFEDKAGFHVGTLTADTATVMPKNIWKEYKAKYYWVLYCSLDGYVYTVTDVLPEQMQKPRRKPL